MSGVTTSLRFPGNSSTAAPSGLAVVGVGSVVLVGSGGSFLVGSGAILPFFKCPIALPVFPSRLDPEKKKIEKIKAAVFHL